MFAAVDWTNVLLATVALGGTIVGAAVSVWIRRIEAQSARSRRAAARRERIPPAPPCVPRVRTDGPDPPTPHPCA